ncbi:hypothetical protein DEO72_LG10g1754 [Vigna unguiculata]|uniref:Uncharacterized protein n=1 Tax=Vigna unguiculata TaxID=3917 RepID=A0A4D6NCN4_VIGUN|nr:hypothetical protein DEO72_LG10g1754 [Vigna unguiculata]
MPPVSRSFERKVTVSLRLPRLKGKDTASHGIGRRVPRAEEEKEVASLAMLLTGHGKEEAAQTSLGFRQMCDGGAYRWSRGRLQGQREEDVTLENNDSFGLMRGP